MGANEEAKRFEEVFEAEIIQHLLSSKGVKWVFYCPANPSEGGVWEKAVQCVKLVLRRTLKNESPKHMYCSPYSSKLKFKTVDSFARRST